MISIFTTPGVTFFTIGAKLLYGPPVRDTGFSSTGIVAVMAETLVLLASEWLTASAEPATRAAPPKARQTSQTLNSVDISPCAKSNCYPGGGFLISVALIVFCLYLFERRVRDRNLSRALHFCKDG